MTRILIYQYYYRFNDQRKYIKNLVQSDDDNLLAEAALIRINSIIAEHDDYLLKNNIENTGNTFTSVDNLSLKHARDHLLDFVQSGQTKIQQKNSSIEALDEIYI